VHAGEGQVQGRGRWGVEQANKECVGGQRPGGSHVQQHQISISTSTHAVSPANQPPGSLTPPQRLP
jgi:hypothetical protein